MIAANVMDRSAALLNDTVQSVFSYAVQIPYLNAAIDEMSELLESNNVPMTNETQAGIIINTGVTDIGGTTGPALPNDLIEIQSVYERLQGATEDFQFVTRVEFLPPFVEQTESLIYYCWQHQTIQFLGATTPREIQLNYIGAVVTNVSSSADTISLFNAKSFLAFRTAALCAQFIGENKERADSLNSDAGMAMDRLLNISTKGRQAIATRRRPFMAGYKVRTGF